jgi:hypothetical protein
VCGLLSGRKQSEHEKRRCENLWFKQGLAGAGCCSEVGAGVPGARIATLCFFANAAICRVAPDYIIVKDVRHAQRLQQRLRKFAL